MNHEWLKRYTSADLSPPRNAVWQVGGLLVATDTKGLIAVEGFGGADLSDARHADEERNRWVPRFAVVVSEPKEPDAMPTTLGDLWAWLDRIERKRCEWCAATGLVGRYDPDARLPEDATYACEDCSGRGWEWGWCEDDRDTATLCGVQVDRNALARWLPPELGAPESPAWLQTAPPEGKAAGRLVVFGAGWKVMAAALTPNAPSNRPGKTYRTYAPGAGAWWETRRQQPPESHPGTDWFVEQHGFEPGDYASMWGEHPAEGTA